MIHVKLFDFKKYMLHVKLTVYYTVSFTCSIYFLNSMYFIFNQFKRNKFSRFFCCWVYYQSRRLMTALRDMGRRTERDRGAGVQGSVNGYMQLRWYRIKVLYYATLNISNIRDEVLGRSV